MRKMFKIALLSLMMVVYLSGASIVEAEDVYVATENYVITSGEEEGQTFMIDYYVAIPHYGQTTLITAQKSLV